jgi:hypothetical protein
MRYALVMLVTLICFTGCSTKKNYRPAADALDAAREFIGACLIGDFEKADAYMIQDASNKQFLKEAETTYRNRTANQQKQLGEASLQNITIEEVSTTATIINYKNSADNIAHKVKAVLNNNIWLIDFKYTFNPNL